MVNIQANEDEAMDMACDRIEKVLLERLCPDHRIILQHCRLADQAMLAQSKKLDICASIFADQTWYCGGQRNAITVGSERADSVVLEDDPLDLSSERPREEPTGGNVSGGHIFPVSKH